MQRRGCKGAAAAAPPAGMEEEVRNTPRWDKALRRARIYSGRIGRMMVGGGLASPCVFLHLPKCGGTSLSEALYAGAPMHRRIGVIDALSTRRAAGVIAFGEDNPLLCHEDLEHGDKTFALREEIALTHACWDTQLIHGHILYTDRLRKHLKDKYKFISLMRNPLNRAISNFRMASNAGVLAPDIDAWLASEAGRNHATVYLRYLSGRAAVPEAETAAALKKARDALSEFALIGFIEAPDHFLRAFKRQFGPQLRLHRYNAAKGPALDLSARQRQRLETLCEPDFRIYEWARAQFLTE